MSDAVTGPQEKDRSLRQYTITLGYLQYENTVYWTRSQFFIVTHAALLGLLVRDFPDKTDVPWMRLFIVAVACGVGLILACLWLKILHSAEGWITRWHDVLIKLEPDAMDDKELFRNVDGIEKKYQIKDVAKRTAQLFLIVWIVAIAYLVVLGAIKLHLLSGVGTC